MATRPKGSAGASGASKVIDRDNGFQALTERVKRYNKLIVACGIHEDAGAHGSSLLTTAEIAAIHEYGTPENRPPKRSWLRDTVDANRADIEKLLRKGAEAVFLGSNPDAEFERIGLWIVGKMQERISAGIAPPLAESTLEKKGYDKATPLIDSGQFRQSIRSKVLKDGGKK